MKHDFAASFSRRLLKIRSPEAGGNRICLAAAGERTGAGVSENWGMVRLLRISALIWGMPVLITSVALLPAQERPTFQTGVAEVHVDAGVFDPNGRPVTGLVKTDFRVFDEGEEQMLTGLDRKSVV